MFASVLIKNGHEVQGMGLAPMSGLLSMQHRGIGTLLAKEDLKILKQNGSPLVIVLGHP